jgi:farnesyl diphosphate synthase
MPLSQRLERTASLIDGRLTTLLENMAASGAPPRLVEAMRLAVLPGGKRLRPFLVIECAGLFGVPTEMALETAAALECLHCYSLVHDDLPAMDNDDLRRGQQTVHRAFDEWTAILAGDALLTLAFQLLAHPDAHADAAVRTELVASLAEAAGARGMVGGQCLDLEADKLGQPSHPSQAHVDRLQGMKTAAIIRFACEAGAILGRADVPQRRALAAYGEHLGRAFQIVDDLLDVEGTTAAVGKATGKDARKPTLISVLGAGGAKARLATLEADALGTLGIFGPKADVLRETVAFVIRRRH